jgi:UDPglucose 6-dehydrogenase
VDVRNITVVGSGYVGMANATMLAKYNNVTILDIDKNRVDMVNNKQSTVEDTAIQEYLDNETLSLTATTDSKTAYENAEWVIIATPTDYDETKNYFNTDSIKSCIRDCLDYNTEAHIVIKSTIPVGFIRSMQTKFGKLDIMFSPEFLREGSALRDCLRPERIVIGSKGSVAKEFAKLIKEAIIPEYPEAPVYYTGKSEAESIKLFANTYLAMRVSFFNELDMYAESMNMNSEEIILGVTSDHRIGKGYCNPSFGYGGYCFPKDTRQLLANFRKQRIPNKIIQSIVYANENRKDWITNRILQCDGVSVVGIHRLVMKSGSDNFRSSAIQGVIQQLINNKIKVVIYEPTLESKDFMGCVVETDHEKFKKLADLIVTNRIDDSLKDVIEKTYTRDIFNDN